jgi:hypothetical protein
MIIKFCMKLISLYVREEINYGIRKLHLNLWNPVINF